MAKKLALGRQQIVTAWRLWAKDCIYYTKPKTYMQTLALMSISRAETLASILWGWDGKALKWTSKMKSVAFRLPQN